MRRDRWDRTVAWLCALAMLVTGLLLTSDLTP